MRSVREYFSLYLKGVSMGAADVVPGVSGGTIAFISGIYEELLNTINSINGRSLKILFKEGISAFWKAINGNFLVVLLAGIGTSIITLAKAISWLLENHPVMIWSFFFGLVLASVVYVSRKIKRWNLSTILALLLGGFAAYYITIMTQVAGSENLAYIFFCGTIAICAMILPGISGSFILVLLGTYNIVLDSIHTVNLPLITIFALGCITGLLLFSRFLSWLLNNFHDITVAVLTGFMLGSLNKVWPWKQTLETFTDHKGRVIPLVEENIPPVQGELLPALGWAIAGFLLIFVIEWIASSKKPAQS
jgi:putative membrane protein